MLGRPVSKVVMIEVKIVQEDWRGGLWSAWRNDRV